MVEWPPAHPPVYPPGEGPVADWTPIRPRKVRLRGLWGPATATHAHSVQKQGVATPTASSRNRPRRLARAHECAEELSLDLGCDRIGIQFKPGQKAVRIGGPVYAHGLDRNLLEARPTQLRGVPCSSSARGDASNLAFHALTDRHRHLAPHHHIGDRQSSHPGSSTRNAPTASHGACGVRPSQRSRLARRVASRGPAGSRASPRPRA